MGGRDQNLAKIEVTKLAEIASLLTQKLFAVVALMELTVFCHDQRVLRVEATTILDVQQLRCTIIRVETFL